MSLSEIASRRSLSTFFLILVGAVLAWSCLLWVLGQTAAVLFSHQAMPISPLDTIPVSANLAQHWGDPAQAWPPEMRAQLPGPAGFYLVSIVVLVVILLAVIGVIALVDEVKAEGGGRDSRKGSKSKRPVATWSSRRDVRDLRPSGEGARLVLGYDTGWRQQPVAAEARHSVIVFGPTQMMKTAGIVIPALLEWVGPAMATSVKPDVIQTTRRHRQTRGQVWVYDPTGGLGRPGDTWSPLASCEDWAGARAMGQWLSAAGAGTQQRDAVSEFFEVLGAKYLGPLLLAAAADDRSMRQVLKWINTGNEKEPAAILERIGEEAACESFEAHCRREERFKGNVVGTAEVLLDVFNDPAVAKSAETSDIDPAALLKGDNTFYLYAPEHQQERLRPLFEGLMQHVMRVAVEQAATCPDGQLPHSFLVLLDEAAHIAPLRNLAKLANTVSAANIQLVSVWHDMAQIRSLFGALGDNVVNGHRAKLLLPGISDPATLEYLSRLIGQTEYSHQSVSRGRHSGDGTTTEAPEYRELAPVELLRQLPKGDAVLLYSNKPPIRLHLRPWFTDRTLRARGQAGQR
jgi:type IV secretion system protein VirD4